MEAFISPELGEERYYLSLWLYSYESFVEHYEWVIEFIEETFTFGDQFGIGLELTADVPPRGKSIRRKFTPKAWEWCKEQLRRGRFWLLMTFPNDFAAPQPFFPYWSVNFLSHNQPKRTDKPPDSKVIPWWEFPVPNELRFAIELPLTIERIPIALQETLVRLGRKTFSKINAVYGFINLSQRDVNADTGGTKFERKHNVTSNDTLYFLDHKVRGAFWENYLTAKHIERLGGIDAIKASTLFARVEEIAPDSMALTLRLTEDINDFSSEKIEQLEQFFQPLSLVQE